MKTQFYLEQLRARNIRVPESWAVRQNSAGDFIEFIKPGRHARESATIEVLLEVWKTEKESAIKSKLSQV